MIERTFRVGDIVTIRGRGEWLLLENCGVIGFDPECRTWRCTGHGPPANYWVKQSDILGRASIATIVTRHKEAAVRKVSCNSPDCWCQKILKEAGKVTLEDVQNDVANMIEGAKRIK